MKKVFVILALFLMLIPNVIADITREFSATTVAQSETLQITYNAVGSGPFVREPVPSGWTVTDTAGGTVTSGVLRLQVGASTTIALQAPNTDGTYPFTGQYIIDGATEWIDFPIQNVVVGGGGPCVPNWVCGAWSNCVNGQQTRTCNDGCGDTRTETQACNGGNGGPTCGDGVCETGETATSCPADCATGNGDEIDICQYFEWAQSISEENYCLVGIGVVFGVVFGFLMLTRRR